MQRAVTALAFVATVAAVGGCGEDEMDARPAVTSEASTSAEGQHGAYSWATDLVDYRDRICVDAMVEPTILAATTDSPDIDDFLDEQLWQPPACTPPLAASGEQFGLVFVPYVYQGDRYSQPVVIGLVVSGAEAVQLVHGSGKPTPVGIEDNGTFAAFPTEPVTALGLEVDGSKYICPVRTLGAGIGQEMSYCERA